MTVTVVGAGSWGTALAVHLGRRGRGVRLWARDPALAETLRVQRRNPYYLSDVELPEAVIVTADLGEAASGAAAVIVAVPSAFCAGILKDMASLPTGVPVVSATKGLDPVHHFRMSEVISRRFPQAAVAVLSGPTFAREVALGQPAAAVIASEDDGLAIALQADLGTREFRLYTNRDVVGVELGGALKNVIALATGLADGLGLGENARAALITRGLAEITRLALAFGGAPATLAGLAGMGDLVLTCTGHLSRNRALGVALGRGRSLTEVTRETRMVAEGVPTVRSALALARRHDVSTPICDEVGAVLFGGKAPREALLSLLGRAATREDGPQPGASHAAPGGSHPAGAARRGPSRQDDA